MQRHSIIINTAGRFIAIQCIIESLLRHSYFKKRAYYEGIRDSYTQIRNENFGRVRASLSRRLRSKIGCLMYRLITPNPWQKSVSEVRIQTDKAYQEGWNFHQSVAGADHHLIEWIRRENYFDADIREFCK